MSFTVEADFAGARNQKAPRPSLLWYTVAFCGKINGDGVERVHLQEIINRIDQRLESLGISALEAERRAGRRDAIRNMRRAVARGKGGVTMRTIDALAPALSATSEWLLTGQDKIEADETTTEIIRIGVSILGRQVNYGG
jgi:hypothetical protein